MTRRLSWSTDSGCGPGADHCTSKTHRCLRRPGPEVEGLDCAFRVKFRHLLLKDRPSPFPATGSAQLERAPLRARGPRPAAGSVPGGIGRPISESATLKSARARAPRWARRGAGRGTGLASGPRFQQTGDRGPAPTGPRVNRGRGGDGDRGVRALPKALRLSECAATRTRTARAARRAGPASGTERGGRSGRGCLLDVETTSPCPTE